jgi:hypothetical protein
MLFNLGPASFASSKQRRLLQLSAQKLKASKAGSGVYRILGASPTEKEGT